MKKVLVTGANGFLGAWLTKRLLEEGLEVTALVRKKSDLSEMSGLKPNWAYGDVTDLQSLQESFQNQDGVFHLAGVVSYKKSDATLLHAVNVVGTENVVQACLSQNVGRLLHVSSVVAIGAGLTPNPLNENSVYNLQKFGLGYFDTKKQAEDIVLQAARQNKIHATAVNPSTIYGFGDARKGSRKNQIKVARGEMPIYTNGGVNVVAVEDVIDGIMLAARKGRNAERYILSAENMTIQKLFESIAAFAGVKPPQHRMPNWLLHTLGFTGDQLLKLGVETGLSSTLARTATLYHWFDSAKAQTELGFKPGSSLKAIENSVRWMRDNGYLK